MELANIKADVDMVTAAVKTLAGVAQKGIDYNATMESYRTSFEAMTGSAEKATEVVERLCTTLESSEGSAISGIQSSASKAGMGLANIKAGVDMVTAAVKTLAGVAQKGIDYNATMESYRTSFEVMTGSAEKATEVVERLRTMGAETPFETTDLVQTTQLLMQYGFTADDAIEKMTMLGDIAQGDANKMNSIALGYAQMSSAGKVNLQDIKQMIDICHAA